MEINSFDDIRHIFYINLEYRIDRKEHIEIQLKNITNICSKLYSFILI